jgi:DNA-binding MarR family transcriptional regulator
MGNRLEALERLIWELRRAFRDLAEAADRQLRVLGIQAADRAFLEFLAREQKPISLSELARKYSLSRQHVQQTLRRLPHPEWVEESADPDDRRTVLLRLSRKGQAAWKKIRMADREFLKQLNGRIPQERILSATELLKQLRRELRGRQGGLE